MLEGESWKWRKKIWNIFCNMDNVRHHVLVE